MRKLLLILIPFFLSACSMLGMGEPTKQLEITEYGLFKNGQLSMQTNGVPKELGTSFGFRFKVKDPKAVPLKAKVVTATPGLLDPSKSKAQMDYVTEITLEPGPTYDLIFTFSEPWEMVTGRWELRVETEKGEVLSQTFDVYDPKM